MAPAAHRPRVPASATARHDARDLAPVIVSNVPDSFAWEVFHRRHPALLQQVRDAFPYSPRQREALDALAEEIVRGPLAALPDSAHDQRRWARWGSDAYVGGSWLDAPFLWAESYFYRRLLAAVEYFTPGPWQGVDPFAPWKRAELNGPVVDAQCAALDDLAALPAEERSATLLSAALWGNRADLGFRLTAADASSDAETPHRVADDSAALWSRIEATGPARLCVVADNAGPELIPDLLLIDHLLATGRVSEVILQVKPYPYYVSDATTADVLDALRRLVRAPGRAGVTGARLWEAMRAERLVLSAHPFSCAPLPYGQMPADLRQEFAACALTLMKGDLNYRRLVGDQLWPATTPFAERTAFFPGPVAALRMLKCDVVVGLSERTVAALDQTGERWRSGGTHALVQFRGPLE